MIVRYNPISLLSCIDNIDHKKLANLLSISEDLLWFYKTDGIDLPDNIINSCCKIFNVDKSLFCF